MRRLAISTLLVATGFVAGLVVTGRMRTATESRAETPPADVQAPPPAARPVAAALAPAGAPDEGRIVCACFNIGLNRIATCIRDSGLISAEQIGATLKAGTNCGSCIPELKELIGHVRCGQAA